MSLFCILSTTASVFCVLSVRVRVCPTAPTSQEGNLGGLHALQIVCVEVFASAGHQSFAAVGCELSLVDGQVSEMHALHLGIANTVNLTGAGNTQRETHTAGDGEKTEKREDEKKAMNGRCRETEAKSACCCLRVICVLLSSCYLRAVVFVLSACCCLRVICGHTCSATVANVRSSKLKR